MTLIRKLGLALLLAGSACSVHEPDRLTLDPVPFSALPGWNSEHPAQVIPVLLRNCTRLAQLPPDRPLGGDAEAARLGGTPAQWAPACAAAKRVPRGKDAAARDFFEHSFQPFSVANNFRPAPLFTGYYEPEILGDVAAGALYPVPLLGRPADLIDITLASTSIGAPVRRMVGRMVDHKLQPYDDRAAIEDGALDGQGLELLWLSDPVDLYFLQIQGSGRVLLPNGRMVRVGYAGQNGRPFVDIGRILEKCCGLTDLSMQGVRDWLHLHPEASREFMDANPSYVFFRREDALKPDEGPLGALGIPLTPGRSAAVDARFLPLGAPLWVDTIDPTDGSRLQRLMLAQDVGGAIRGPARADLFFGWGHEAEEHAGGMWGRGGAYVLLPREPDELVADTEPQAAEKTRTIMFARSDR